MVWIRQNIGPDMRSKLLSADDTNRQYAFCSILFGSSLLEKVLVYVFPINKGLNRTITNSEYLNEMTRIGGFYQGPYFLYIVKTS